MSIDDTDDPDGGHAGALLAPLREVDPGSPPRYRLDAATAEGRRRTRRRRLGSALAGGLAVAVVLALTGTVTTHLGNPVDRMTAAEQGYGSYDPLVLRLDPGWLPDGVNSYTASGTRFGERASQGMMVAHVTGTPKLLGMTWGIGISLFAPGTEPRHEDAPLEGVRFGQGRSVDPIRGMPAERLGDGDGYTISWRYPSGAHAAVTVLQMSGQRLDRNDTVHIPANTGFGDRTVAVARRVAENLRIDGHTALRFPFTMRPPAGQRLVYGGVSWFRQPGQKLVTEASLGYAPPTATPGDRYTTSDVDVDSRVNEGDPTGTGEPSSESGGRIYLVPDTHGFFLTVRLKAGNAKRIADGVRVFGDPGDMSTWRAHPVVHD